MPHQTKIATCSYCGRRQTLRLSAREGHELACGACGAPLHEMKWLKPPEPDRPKKRSPRLQAPHGSERGRDFGGHDRRDWDRRDWDGDEDPRRRRRKKRKPMWKKVAEEAFDLLDDIFD